jgi:hypothetical protein
MISLNITQQQIERSKNHYEFGTLENSITDGQRNELGALGEIVVLDYYNSIGSDIVDASERSYDVIIDGKTTDVKTRPINYPKPHHTINVPAYSIKKQNCEYYLFVFIRKDLKRAYLVGYIHKREFLRIARFYKEGEPGTFNFTFPCDTYQIIVRQLTDIKQKRNQ